MWKGGGRGGGFGVRRVKRAVSIVHMGHGEPPDLKVCGRIFPAPCREVTGCQGFPGRNKKLYPARASDIMVYSPEVINPANRA